MANRDQLRRLKRSVKVWNRWRSSHPEEVPKLASGNFKGVCLDEPDLKNADLREAWLPDVSLVNVKAQRAELIDANLRGADLTGADLTDAKLMNANLVGAILNGTVLGLSRRLAQELLAPGEVNEQLIVEVLPVGQ